MTTSAIEKPAQNGLRGRSSFTKGGNTELSADAAKLMAMGYEPQLKRNLSTLQLIGVAFMVTASWLGVTGGFTTGVVIGGSVCLVYGLIIVAVLSTFFAITLAELSSAMPTAGGQYYWVSILAPGRAARPSAFFTGLCNLAGGIVSTAGASVLIGHMILACVKLCHPSFEIRAWQLYLVGLAFNWSGCIININKSFVAKSVSIGMFVSIVVCLAIVVAVPAASPSHTSPSFIFTSTNNVSGWNSKGTAFLAGLINANYSFGLIDSAVHLAEDIENPEKNVPKALFFTVGIGFVTAWPLAILLMYCLTDFDDVVNTATGVPLLELFFISFNRSKAGAVIMMSGLIVCWAFARDNGLPLSKVWSRVHPTMDVPVHALILCSVLVSILSALCIASSTAFNSLAAGVIIFPSLSYTLPAIYSLLPRNKHIKGPFNLGIIGTISKVITAAFCIFATVIYSFPYVMPTTASNMNYISAIIGVFFIWVVLDWAVRARKYFILRELEE
ncbi:hypothetical protein FOMA001_g18293 [Fusarium oxysporum f. sp. matthiolae]|nr:hypothetical protein FOMA001_g18293 [Fusarium oxysporum f. sp. matthiolae]